MANTAFATVSADSALYIRDELLEIAEKNTVFAQHALKVKLPQHNSKTIQFSRYPRLTLPQTPAAEGVTPASQQLTVETVSAVVDQWILIVTLTDLAQLTIKHPLVPVVTERLGMAKAELVDREIQKVLLASDAVMFAGTGNSRADLATTDVLESTGIRKVWKTLRRNGARALSGGNYLAIVDPEVSQDISDDTKFHSAHELKDVSALYNNEIGEWLGFRVMVSNFIPTHALIADADWTSATAVTGSWAGSTVSLFVKITRVESDFGFETDISNAENVNVADGQKVNISFPTTPASGVTYNVYASDTNNTSTDANLRLISTGNAPSTTLDITTIITDLPTADNFPVTAPASPSTGVTVHTSYMFGKETYSMVDLSGDNLRVLITPSGPSKSDPADQRRPLSLKGSFKSVLLNQDFLRRMESASAFD